MHYWRLERKLWWWQDSSVWKMGDNVVKFYRRLSLQDVRHYHKMQSDVADVLSDKLNGKVVPKKSISWGEQSVSMLDVRVLKLSEMSIFENFNAIFWEDRFQSKICPDQYTYSCISVVPFVSWTPLSHSSCDPVSEVTKMLTDTLISLWLSLGSNNDISSVNVRVDWFNSGTLTLVITDVWSSITRLLDTSATQSPPSALNHLQDPLSP